MPRCLRFGIDEPFEQLAEVRAYFRESGPCSQTVVLKPREKVEMQVVDGLLCGFPVCIEKVKTRGSDPLAIALK